MSFLPSEHLARRACLVLLASVGLHRRGYCDNEGRFTPAAFRIVETGNDGSLSDGETLMLRIAVDIWNGHGGAALAEILQTLDRERTALVCSSSLATQRNRTPPSQIGCDNAAPNNK